MRNLAGLKEKDLLFFDIETASLVKELKLGTPLFDSWEYKVNKDGKMTEAAIIESYAKKAGLYPEFSKVISVVLGTIRKGLHSNQISLVAIDDDNERDLLNNVAQGFKKMDNYTLVGFMNKAFDTPFLMKRMLINKIVPPLSIDTSGLKPWEITEIDLALEWKSTSFERASLINVTTAFGLPSSKSDISGADVGRVYWEEGVKGLNRITEYCKRDVCSIINLYRKMTLKNEIFYHDRER